MLQINATDRDYLSGKSFSTIYEFSLKGSSNPQTRLEWLVPIVRGKRVIHFGCVDHLSIVEQRRKEKTWLHDILAQQCTDLAGIDIDEQGIHYMQGEGFEVYRANVLTDPAPAEVLQRKWDYLVAGEVLEHIDNPVAFLTAIREKYGPVTDKIIITVPNAMSYTNFRFALRNTELINSDHRFWFSPFTLLKVAKQAGIEPEAYDLCVDVHASPLSIKYWLRNRPMFRNRVVLVGRLNG
ncbi:MAG: methyltransferase domain-containing protein [Saprospiraceae bacterium]|nr:methyltransferase domain-containing protein [Saprospiraceae bacterium]